MKMINIFFLLVLCLVTITSHRVDGSQSTVKENLELERQLKLINKLPIKSIQTKFEYMVDCVDINKQPAFDHPLLKNHKLQRRPLFHIKNGKTSAKNSPTNLMFGLEKVECPTGTVPIRRTTKDDLIRSKSLWNDNILTTNVVRHNAEVSLKKPGQQLYYGVSGTTSVYNLKINIAQSSSSHIHIQNGDGTNKIIVGWHSDNFKKTGCYNMQCQGFVQVDSQFHIGGAVSNVSVYGGPMSDLPITIFQGNNKWWVMIHNKAVGYFPVALFTNLYVADQVSWGGATIAIDAPSPPMGSGYFPDGNLYHSCYFKNIAFKNGTTSPNFGPDKLSIQEFTDSPKCYGVEYYEKTKYGSDDYTLLFGGPGGNECT
ncbi:unnamed protein product [Trifolium pratense]|uniref:Uncharacterized protein n=1 Tax=Trifolium pratense TaxID=57577 RepID=A0ACB0L3T8_TRIPR|nr:unnamed protein product [Trifolium pratense]